MKRITLYTSNQCPHCVAAKQYFKNQRLAFREISVNTPRGQKALTRLGYRSVPVIQIGDQVIQGFSVKAVQQALKN